MNTMQNKWEKGVRKAMKYETPLMEMVTLQQNDIITMSVGGQGTGTVVKPPFPNATRSYWE